MQRDLAFNNLKSVSEEYDASKFSLAEILRALGQGLTVSRHAAQGGISRGQLERCRESLEATYIVRLFAEFEGILLDYWRESRGRKTKPKMETLVNRVADLRNTSPNDRADAHHVRNYRNDIVHKQKSVPPLTFQECRSRLARFLGWLPVQW